MKIVIPGRQGDVIVVKVKDIPADAKLLKREKGRVILAHGELTGHAHAISDRGARLLETAAKMTFLEVTDETVHIRHEEHAPVALPKGFYRVVRQTEYSPEALRNVAD